jgi:hypothetical protein
MVGMVAKAVEVETMAVEVVVVAKLAVEMVMEVTEEKMVVVATVVVMEED